MRIGAGSSPEVATMSAQFNTAALPPGRYLARGTLRQGGKPQGHMIRPFRIVADPAAAAGGAPATVGAVPNEMAMLLLGGVSNFDRKELLAPAMLTSMFAIADARATGSKAALKEARAGDLAPPQSPRSVRAIRSSPHSSRASSCIRARNSIAPRSSSRTRCRWRRPSRRRGCSSAPRSPKAIATRKPPACCRAQSLPSLRRRRMRAIARIAGEEWIKAGQPALAVTALELAVQQPNADARSKKVLGIAYVLGGRGGEAVAVLSSYLETNPADSAALLAAIFGTYTRHLNGPQAATLAADRANLAKWSKAYASTKGPMQPLVDAWVKHVSSMK